VDGVERDGREIDEADVAIEAAVEAEVAEVGGDAVEVGRVVAEDGDGDAGFGFGGSEVVEGVGDVEEELVVAALVGSNQLRADPERGGLAGPLEVEEGAAGGEGIFDREVGAVPALATEVGMVGIAGVGGIEAVG
jgi:hypothetical protein